MKLLLRLSDIYIEDRLEPQQPKELERWILDLIDEKKEKYKTRLKTKIKINCIDSIVVLMNRLQSAMTYAYIASRTLLFESNMRKSFLNKLNLKL
jgi:hypothetical protein